MVFCVVAAGLPSSSPPYIAVLFHRRASEPSQLTLLSFSQTLNAAIVIALANLPLYEHLTAHWVLYCEQRSLKSSLLGADPLLSAQT